MTDELRIYTKVNERNWNAMADRLGLKQRHGYSGGHSTDYMTYRSWDKGQVCWTRAWVVANDLKPAPLNYREVSNDEFERLVKEDREKRGSKFEDGKWTYDEKI